MEECDGLTYETVKVDLQNKSQEFVDLYAVANPLPGARAKVPLLQIIAGANPEKEQVLTESLVLTEYIAEQYGRDKLLPSTAQDRATMRLFTELCGASCFSYIPILRAQQTKNHEPDNNNSDDYQSAVETFQQGLIKANAFLQHYMTKSQSGGPFLFGDGFSVAECNAAPFVQRACTILPAFCQIDVWQLCDELNLPYLRRWMQAVLTRPSVVETGVPPDEMIGNVQRLLERMATAAAAPGVSK